MNVERNDFLHNHHSVLRYYGHCKYYDYTFCMSCSLFLLRWSGSEKVWVTVPCFKYLSAAIVYCRVVVESVTNWRVRVQVRVTKNGTQVQLESESRVLQLWCIVVVGCKIFRSKSLSKCARLSLGILAMFQR
jgi:hypothetical protein